MWSANVRALVYIENNNEGESHVPKQTVLRGRVGFACPHEAEK